MASKGTKIALWVVGILLVLAIIIAVVLWKVGLFATPEVSLQERGPYNYVYVERTGPFQDIPKGYQQVDSLVKQQNIDVGIRCGAYLDDPTKVAQNNLRWRVGNIVQDSMEVTEPLMCLTIEQHQYLVASIHANPMIAPFKTYPAIEKWLSENPYEAVGPAYELYQDDGLIEVLFPVDPKSN
jgi:effector-binding domain-containing protein